MLSEQPFRVVWEKYTNKHSTAQLSSTRSKMCQLGRVGACRLFSIVSLHLAREFPRKCGVPCKHFIAILCRRGGWEWRGQADNVRSETRWRWERLVARWKQERQHDELPLISVWLWPSRLPAHRPCWHLPADSSALTFPLHNTHIHTGMRTHTHTCKLAHKQVMQRPHSGMTLSGITHPAFSFLLTFPQDLHRPFFHFHVCLGHPCFSWMGAHNCGRKPWGKTNWGTTQDFLTATSSPQTPLRFCK